MHGSCVACAHPSPTSLALFAASAAEPLVVPNDRITLEGIAQLVAEGAVHNIVISPGPGTPECSSDIGGYSSLFSRQLHCSASRPGQAGQGILWLASVQQRQAAKN